MRKSPPNIRIRHRLLHYSARQASARQREPSTGTQGVAKYDIEITAERCTGCLRCQLACSDLFSRAFNPSRSRIQVIFSDVDCSIQFTQECNSCGVCADHCFYDVIHKHRRQAR
jgi:ferredoxin